jgi:hypothetical protein
MSGAFTAAPIGFPIVTVIHSDRLDLTDCTPLDGELRYRHLPLTDDDQANAILLKSKTEAIPKTESRLPRSTPGQAPTASAEIGNGFETLLYRERCRTK